MVSKSRLGYFSTALLRMRSVPGKASVLPSARRPIYSADHGPIPEIDKRRSLVSSAFKGVRRSISREETRRENSLIALLRACVVFTANKSDLANTFEVGNKKEALPVSG